MENNYHVRVLLIKLYKNERDKTFPNNKDTFWECFTTLEEALNWLEIEHGIYRSEIIFKENYKTSLIGGLINNNFVIALSDCNCNERIK